MAQAVEERTLVTYIYEPLPEHCIRVLVLQPGNFREPLHASLGIRELHERIYDAESGASVNGYEAISYAWGSSDLNREIILDESSILSLTTSLYTALQRFRLPDRTRVLWADAICIDQDNVPEKETQVAHMGDVYRLADTVLVWLGESDGYDRYAFALFELAPVGESGEPLSMEEYKRFVETKVPPCICCPEVDLVNPGRTLDLLRAAVASIYARPWFQRLWVVQEVVRSRSVRIYSGSHRISLGEFNDFWGITLSGEVESVLVGLPPFDVERVNCIMSACYAGYPCSLPETVYRTWSQKCANPLDRIYGVRAFTTTGSHTDLEPDYALTACQLFSRATTAALTDSEADTYQSGTLSAALLALAPSTRSAASNEQSDGWPSWVPDYCSLTVESLSIISRYDIGEDGVQFEYTQPLCRPLALDNLSDSTKIRVSGKAFAKVLKVLPGSEVCKITGYIDAYLIGEGLMNPPLLSRTVSEDIFDEWLRRCGTFVANGLDLQSHFNVDVTLEKLGGYSFASHPDKYDPSVDMPEKARALAIVHLLLCCMKDSLHAHKGLAARKVARSLLSWLSGPLGLIGDARILAIISVRNRKFVGWVPPATCENDEVCVIYGAPWPFVIRQQSDSDDYTLLGDAYFNGMTEADIHEPQSAMADWCAARHARLEVSKKEKGFGRDAVRQFMAENVLDLPPGDDWVCLR